MPSQRKVPPSTGGEVENIDWRNLNPLDRIARFILALGYSGTQAQGKAQEYIGANTVAVAKPPDSNRLYVAHNSLWQMWHRERSQRAAFNRGTVNAALSNVRQELQQEFRTQNLVIVWINKWQTFYTQRTYHAEMQLVDFFGDKRWRFEGDIIGTSKACCRKCAEALDRLGIRYSYWHERRVDENWRPPRYQRRWW
jgi:hypothetical protein